MSAYPRWALWLPGSIGDLTDVLCDMENLTSWRFAMVALVGVLDEGFGPATLGPVFERLMASDVDSWPDAGLGRDRPARQRMLALGRELVGWARLRQDEQEALAELAGVGELLAQRPDHLGLGLELIAWGMPLEGDLGARLDRIGSLVEGRPIAAQGLADMLWTRLSRARERLTLDSVRQAAARLAAKSGVADGLLALSLARCAAASPSGWANERDRDVLRVLRRHPDPDVRALALSHFTWTE